MKSKIKNKKMKIDNHSDSNRKKVAKAILKFWQYSPKQFKSMDLINFVKAETGIEHIFFDTILRNMRQLKQDEKINYNCPIRKDMIYIKV